MWDNRDETWKRALAWQLGARVLSLAFSSVCQPWETRFLPSLVSLICNRFGKRLWGPF